MYLRSNRLVYTGEVDVHDDIDSTLLLTHLANCLNTAHGRAVRVESGRVTFQGGSLWVRVRGSDGRRCYSPRVIPSQRFTVSAAGDNMGWNHGCISGPGVRTVSSAALHPVRLGLANRGEPRYWNSTLAKLRSPLDQQCSAPDPMTGPVFRSRWLHPSFAGSETERVLRLKKRKGPAVLAAGRLGALQLGTGTLTCGRHRGHHRHGIRPHHGIHRRHGSYPRLGIRDHH